MSASDNITQEILEADEARYRALYAQNLTMLEAMLHDDYVHTHANGKVDDKQKFLASVKTAKYRFVRADRIDQKVRVLAGAALLSGRTNTTIEVGAEVKTMHNAFVTAWTFDAGHWRLLHWQATKIVDA